LNKVRQPLKSLRPQCGNDEFVRCDHSKIVVEQADNLIIGNLAELAKACQQLEWSETSHSARLVRTDRRYVKYAAGMPRIPRTPASVLMISAIADRSMSVSRNEVFADSNVATQACYHYCAIFMMEVESPHL
jgi:hypothetical protein